jgi:hypothetical protein
MFAHLLDANDFEPFALQGKDQTIETGQLNGILSAAIPFEGVTAKPWQGHQFINVPRLFDDVDPLDISPGNVVSKGLNRFRRITVCSFQFAGTKGDFHSRCAPYILPFG